MAIFAWILKLLLILQVVSHALAQDNALPYFDDDDFTVNVLEDHNKSLPILASSYSANDDENDDITYELVGVGSDIFTVENLPDGFNIYFKNSVNIDREVRDEYIVEISANDGQDHGDADLHTVTITIKILDINDHHPQFTNLPQTVQFNEDTDLTTLLLHIAATDKDAGKNSRIKYRIESVTPSSGLDKFTISVSSGELRLAKALDYENTTEYDITVVAQDHGDSPLETAAVLTVEVLDVNDNDPKFTQVLYTAQIYESLSEGSFVLEVEAMDQDKMLDYDIIYSIDNISPILNGSEGLFTIDNITGSVYVGGVLEADFGSPSKYSIVIRGEEDVDPFRATTTIAEITILDINDNPPKFEQLSYNGSLSESSLIGTTVVTVTAMDEDQGSNAEFTFSLVNLLSGSLPFNITQSIDGESGHIQLVQSIDFEDTEQYKFEVVASEVVENGTKTASTVVTVFVTNVNDNVPQFDRSEYSVNVSETAEVGDFVGKVLAEDADKGVFGEVYYSLNNFINIFEIDNITGRVTLKEEVDYEETKSFALTIVASDSGMPVSDQQKTQVQMQVNILDANDNGPIISVNGSDSVQEVEKLIEEQQDPGVLVFVVEADDVDDPPFDELQYFIEVLEPSGLNSTHFQYSETAKNQLITSVPLNYENIEQYKLKACVTDLGDLINEVSGSGSGAMIQYPSINHLPSDHVDCINVIVKVVDENDNPPVFVGGVDSYAYDVVEEKSAKTFVGYANATDADSGLFGTVRYSLSGVDHENFTIDNETGEILTAGPIDRESKDRFDLIVTARDLDPVTPLSATATLTITIIDINDNVPKFSQPVYVENDIIENSNQVNIQVSADDEDIDENDDLTYTIIAGNTDNQFIIDSASGLIEKNPIVVLDREENPDFELIIEVSDGGLPSLSSNATVFIEIQDENDNEPLFEQNTYYVNVTEGTLIDSQILTVKADDPDDGSNGVIRYSIVAGGDSGFFDIGQSSGVITTKKDFDFDTEKTLYSIDIQAIDSGEVPKHSIACVEIYILDINDNSPIFSEVQYSKSVSEMVSGGTSLITIEASDLDSGVNQEITYSISNVTIIGTYTETNEQAYITSGLFMIDDESGVISLVVGRSLDYESVMAYSILVEAVDGGTPSQTDSSLVQLTVLDYNDNSPMLSEESYSLVIEEDTETQTTFNIFSYEDADSGDNAVVSYSINNDNFTIDATTGVLTLTSKLDFEELEYFEFEVTITDGGSPSLSDISVVNVTVVDTNDNRPVFVTPLNVIIELNESNYTYPADLLLYTFDATDEDSDINSLLEYEISSGNSQLFSIDSSTGKLSVVGNINRENEDSYELTVTVADGGNPSLSAMATVQITVLDVNEEPPLFEDDVYSKSIEENNAVNLFLVQVQALDSDLGNNAAITYSINDTVNFMISSDGTIRAKSIFNFEEVQNVDVLVTATDGGGLYSTALFSLSITDLNDNDPVFTNVFSAPFEVSENEMVKYVLANSSATDADSNANGDVTYTIAGAQGKFSVNSDGIVTLEATLDREVTEYYYLTVIAVDHGSNQRTSTNQINVTVTDINDETPVFEASFYSIETNENATMGSTLITVSATDKDIGQNGQVEFSIISGNTGNIFGVSTQYNAMDDAYKGYITLDSSLDYEMETSYSLQILASDKGSSVLTSTAFVSVKILNVNDEVPVFSPSDSYVFSISEIAVSGTPVGTILATDDDAGIFGKISSYGFSAGTDSSVLTNFDLSASTGVISLSNTSSLDFDNGQQQYSFTVVAEDGGGATSVATVVVNILGHNEMAPSFDDQSYSGSILENVAVDTFVVQVTANDPDNNQITYSITEGNTNDNFKIDAMGRIANAKVLDREDKEVYVLRIQAADDESNPLYGYTQVEITVTDENDNAPMFPSATVEYQVLESSTGVLNPVVAATDDDKGDNSLITYSVEGEGIPDIFNVNNSTGEIKVTGTLNYELETQYKFTILAKDGGNVSMNGTLTVTIIVLDFNDNEPQFDRNVYTASISESVESGSIITTVFANDSDSGMNAAITYTIDEPDKFAVNSIGEVSLKQQLDYEFASSYSLVVTATDGGTPIKSGTAVLELTVVDANDEAPMFSLPSYAYTIKEQNIFTPVSLLTVDATDDDGTSPNNEITYNITSGNEDQKFTINSNGLLLAIKSLDYEMEQEYVLEVTAMDNPVNISDRKYSSVDVTITIEDVNDNSPVWKENVYRVTPNQFAGTVLENAEVDTTVLFVEATDEDSGSFGQVTYSFVTPSDKFYVNETSGFVYTYGGLDVELVDFYNLTILAEDGGSKSTTGYLSIEVIDINDKEPSFLSSFYYKNVKENIAIIQPVITLTAFDIDSDDLVYTIIAGNNEGFFKINSSSGEVGLAKELDREEESDFLLTVFVSDGLFNDTTNLRIVVDDVNDNAPAFIDAPYFAYIPENTVSGAVLLFNGDGNTTRVQAIDADEPNTPNSIVVYEMINPNADVLNIGPSTGVLTVASGANLNYEDVQTVVVNVRAQDSVPPAEVMFSTTTITIHVLDENDNSPEFMKTSYSTAVDEDEPTGTTIVNDIKANDVDTGDGGVVTYSIVSSTPSGNLNDFNINSTTGVVTLASPLDREETNIITLVIRATDGGPSIFNTAEVSLIVNVIDVNDNRPVFNDTSYFKSVLESIGASQPILTVLATDDDVNNNADITYSLINYNSVFDINEDTGAITTATGLDHEEQNYYTIIVEACDNGSPMLCSNRTVSVQVSDVNDLSPVFDYDVYYTTVCDDATPVSVVMQVIALDGDSNEFGEVTYSLASGSDLGNLFTLDETNGQIELVNDLTDDETSSPVVVDIIASDGGNPSLTGTTQVQIFFCELNNSTIYFNESLFYGVVTENQQPPVDIITLTAITSYQPITYSILPLKSDNYFNISQAGAITTNTMLDREERATYTLIVQARDSAPVPGTAYAAISVAVLDINDNPPLFLLPPYMFTLTEELTTKTVIDTVVAIDPDKPFNPYGVTYSIDSTSNPNGVFTIDENGTISAVKPVDREETPQYNLKIRATDMDPSDPRITTATATITILDINDNKPVFDLANYTASVSENHAPSFSILQVSATDDDLDLNREITYSIYSGGDGKFFLDSTTGILKTLTQLNYEAQPFYTITVMAKDKGSPSQTSFVNVTITVEDYNDCTPMFDMDSYTLTLKEDYDIGQILDINATDCDSSVNSEITFSIVAGNNDNKFELNPTTGILSLKQSLDFESDTSYIIQIQAVDSGSPSLSNLTQIVIGVSDVNDETPVFQQSTYTDHIDEDLNVGFVVYSVIATDDDASDENSDLVYSILEGNSGDAFKIDVDSGAIEVNNALDREEIDSYTLIIGVQDTGNPPRSANTTVIFIIDDVNDNEPVITNLLPGASLDVYEDARKNMELFDVNATDEDIGYNGQLEFSLQNYQNIFYINPNTGVISLIGALDYDESDREYQLSVEVTDLAIMETRLVDQATLNIQVKDINDNDPVFAQTEYTSTRPEEEDPGQVFATVEATDNDGTTENNKITYIITDCVPGCSGSFQVNESTGAVSNTAPLDRETEDTFVLTIMGINLNASPELNDSTTLTVSITDINDHAPAFSDSSYSTDISEGVASGTPLLTVMATDDDQINTTNTELSYKIVTVIPNNPFLLDETTGQLEVTGSIDRESVSSYSFTVRVEDNGDIKLHADVPVTITVNDENDEPPYFTSRSHNAIVNEGTLVSELPVILWSPSYTDGDELTENTNSVYEIVAVFNGSESLGPNSPLVMINRTSGEVSFNSLVDFETTKSLVVTISVNNTKAGTGDICGGFESSCGFSDTATLNIEITDFNDNRPIFQRSSYTGQISTSAVPGTQIRQVIATDKDSQHNYGEVRYRLGEGSSSKFNIISDTGLVVSRGSFENDDRKEFNLEILAYDNLGVDPSLTSSVQMTVTALNDFRRILIVFNKNVDVFTEEKEKLIVDVLRNLTGYTIVVETIREHVSDDSGDIDDTKTDFIFHAVNNDGEIIDFDELIDKLEVAAFFNAIIECEPISISALHDQENYPKVESVMIYLIVICGILIIGSIIVLVLACQQRYIALNSLWKSQLRDAFYGANDPSLIEGAVPRDFSGETFEMKGRTKTNQLYVEPYTSNFGGRTGSALGSSIGDIDSMQQDNPLYEERELKMEMFEVSDDETEGDLDDDNLLAEALKDDDSDGGSVTAI